MQLRNKSTRNEQNGKIYLGKKEKFARKNLRENDVPAN